MLGFGLGCRGRCRGRGRHTHWWACTSRQAGWGCPGSQGHTWGRAGGEQLFCAPPVQPTSRRRLPSPLTAAACVARGTGVTGGLAISIQKARVRESVGVKGAAHGAGWGPGPALPWGKDYRPHGHGTLWGTMLPPAHLFLICSDGRKPERESESQRPKGTSTAQLRDQSPPPCLERGPSPCTSQV